MGKIAVSPKNFTQSDPKDAVFLFVDAEQRKEKALWERRKLRDGDALEGINLSRKLPNQKIMTGLKSLILRRCNGKNIDPDTSWILEGGLWNCHEEVFEPSPQEISQIEERAPIEDVLFHKGDSKVLDFIGKERV